LTGRIAAWSGAAHHPHPKVTSIGDHHVVRPLSLFLVACLALSGCGVIGRDTADRCASVNADMETLKSSVEQAAEDINAMGERPQAKLVGANWATNTSGSVDDSAGEAWDARRQAMVDQINTDGVIMAHLTVDHPSCFSDWQVARAKTALGSQ
jgi:outer membrane murein-binding lipoprotein Lpp